MHPSKCININKHSLKTENKMEIVCWFCWSIVKAYHSVSLNKNRNKSSDAILFGIWPTERFKTILYFITWLCCLFNETMKAKSNVLFVFLYIYIFFSTFSIEFSSLKWGNAFIWTNPKRRTDLYENISVCIWREKAERRKIM